MGIEETSISSLDFGLQEEKNKVTPNRKRRKQGKDLKELDMVIFSKNGQFIENKRHSPKLNLIFPNFIQ